LLTNEQNNGFALVECVIGTVATAAVSTALGVGGSIAFPVVVAAALLVGALAYMA